MAETVDSKRWMELVDEEVKRVKESADEFIKTYIEPMADIGNPEDILNKKYEQWTPQDMESLKQVYVYDIKPLEEFIAKKEIDKLWGYEAETMGLEVQYGI